MKICMYWIDFFFLDSFASELDNYSYLKTKDDRRSMFEGEFFGQSWTNSRLNLVSAVARNKEG